MVVLLRRHRRRGVRSSALGRTTIHTSPLDGFDKVKMAYKRRRKDAESSRNAEFFVKLDRAYDTVMMEQVQNRKKGVAYGSIQVAKDIKYADHQPIVPWGPRYSRSTAKDLCINMAISASFIMCISTMGHADWKPLRFLCFAYFYRILEKLKATEPAVTPVYNEYGEVEGRGIHMAKRVLRSLGLVLGSILAASLGYTGLANLSQFLGQYILSVIYNFQELIVTTASPVLLCILLRTTDSNLCPTAPWFCCLDTLPLTHLEEGACLITDGLTPAYSAAEPPKLCKFLSDPFLHL